MNKEEKRKMKTLELNSKEDFSIIYISLFVGVISLFANRIFIC